jgi:alpha-galactosidase
MPRQFRHTLFILAGLTGLCPLLALGSGPAQSFPDDHNAFKPVDAIRWAAAAFSNESVPKLSGIPMGSGLPFSFVYGGRPWPESRSEWKYKAHKDEPLRKSMEWLDSRTGLAVTCEVRQFDEYPAVDWVVGFENRGARDMPVIKDIRTLSAPLEGPFPFKIQGTNGGRSRDDDFMPVKLTVNDDGRMAALSSPEFSSNHHAPFFAVENDAGAGVVIGVQRGEYYLRPGEKVRAARVLMMLWKGNLEDARNQFRRLLYDHYIPGLNGRPHEPLVTVNTCFTYKGAGNFLEKANQFNVRPLVEPFAEIGAEAMVIDACWYDGEPWYEWQGNWTFSKRRYPDGFKPIADACGRNGMFFGLWFTPEVVSPTVPLAREHKDWAFWGPEGPDPNRNGSLSLGRPEAREWFLGQVDALVKNEGINFYRNDGGADWFGDDPGRSGFNEAIHVAGLYQLWDSLRERHPGLVMEGCMGGGRRIDLETIQRFLWHQKSDRWFQTEPDQAAVYGANLLLPGGLINLPTDRTDDYGCWSSFGGQLCLAWDPIDPGFPRARAGEQVRLYKKIRHLLSGDFHPLTPCSVDAPWLAYQFHRPDLNAGVVMVFRRPARIAGGTRFLAALKSIDPAKTYVVHFQTEDKGRKMTGAAMISGIAVEMKSLPGAEIVIYSVDVNR